MRCLAATLSLLFATMSLFAEPLTVGSTAPGPAVTVQDGSTVDLAQLYAAGPVLVYFYPKADTPGCTAQACNLRDHFADLQTQGITVLGASLDPVSAQQAFRDKYQLPFRLVADADGKLADAFGVPHLMGFAKRQSFLVVGGKIVWRDLGARPATQAQDALAALAAHAAAAR